MCDAEWRICKGLVYGMKESTMAIKQKDKTSWRARASYNKGIICICGWISKVSKMDRCEGVVKGAKLVDVGEEANKVVSRKRARRKSSKFN